MTPMLCAKLQKHWSSEVDVIGECVSQLLFLLDFGPIFFIDTDPRQQKYHIKLGV